MTDKGLAFDGSTGYAATSATVLDTSVSYTVSAWVRVDASASRTLTVLSQAPDSASPFSKKYVPFGLSYAGGANTWSMEGSALLRAWFSSPWFAHPHVVEQRDHVNRHRQGGGSHWGR